MLTSAMASDSVSVFNVHELLPRSAAVRQAASAAVLAIRASSAVCALHCRAVARTAAQC
jgi:hypothetical protein